YVKKRVFDQIKSVSIIVLYLIFFQIFILGLPIVKIIPITIGIFLVILGLAFFMEGLVLGIMPLGEISGVKLPQKTFLLPILIFAFIIGLGATFAEPSIGILKASGSFIKPWSAPLLFVILNKYSFLLIISIGIGVGIAVLFGILRFIYNWSLKPFIFIIIPILLSISFYGNFDKNISSIIGLAWDCGGITTGPVTVPLILSLGIGISRVYSNKSGVANGFGVVTLASAFPIFTVLLLGFFLNGMVIKPINEDNFYKAENRNEVLNLFKDEDDFFRYTIRYGSKQSIESIFVSKKMDKMNFVLELIKTEKDFNKYFSNKEDFYKFLDKNYETLEIQLIKQKFESTNYNGYQENKKPLALKILLKNFLVSSQAILPLSIFLILVLFIIREKIRYFDEIMLGIFFALVGMTFFNIGIDIGLSNLGNQVGYKLPSSFKTIQLEDQK
ncbi:MAG TPA: DUF1538 family protein, partial [Spirochaetota bacterium]|nr:DUF1538 family protein [Spirochaetota bacterium]